MKDTIRKLNHALQTDSNYRHTWIANLNMAQQDAEVNYRKETGKVGKYLNRLDKALIANNASNNFLESLARAGK